MACGRAIDSSAEAVAALQDCQRETLAIGVSFDPLGWDGALEALEANTTVKELRLTFDFIVEADVVERTIRTTLSHPSLRSLRLSHILLVSETSQAAEMLSILLAENPVLTELSIVSSFLGDSGAAFAAEALMHNRALVSAEFRDNRITETGATFLAHALPFNRTLTSLNLQSNEIGDEGMGNLAQSLQINRVLCNLHVGENSIGDKAMTRLAAALQVNTALTQLNLAENRVSDQGLSLLAASLKVNKALKSLCLEQLNQVSDAGAYTLLQVLEVNHSLTCIDLAECRIQPELLQQIETLTARNKEPPLVLALREEAGRLSFAKMSGEAARDLHGLQVTSALEPTTQLCALKATVKEHLDLPDRRVDVVLPDGRLLRHLPDHVALADVLQEGQGCSGTP